MRHQFWQQRGPLGVLQELRNLLVSREDVVVHAPRWSPDPVQPLTSVLSDHQVIFVDAETPSAIPEDILHNVPGFRDTDKSDELPADAIVLVRTGTKTPLHAWISFIATHYHATRYTPGRPRFVLFVEAAESVEGAHAVPVFRWSGVVGRYEMRQYVDDLWASTYLPPLERDLCSAMTREVSCWCPETAERIAEGGIEIAFRPYDLLKHIAAERQWDAAKIAEWTLGTLDWYDHIEVVHPAYAVVSGNSREIRDRLWRAQLEVLFPVLNSVRIAFAQQYPELFQNLVLQDGKLCPVQGAATLNPLDIDIGPMVHWLTT